MDSEQLKRGIRKMIFSELDLRGRTEESLGWDDPLFGGALGLDSLDALQLATALEERFGVQVPEGDEAREVFLSISSMAEYVIRARQP
jgi:acyl carrier protein